MKTTDINPSSSVVKTKELKLISAILDELETKTTKADKLDILKENDSKMLRFILQAAFDKNVQSILPDGEPPYSPGPKENQVSLYELEPDFPKLFKNGPMTKSPLVKVEMVFMNMLKSLSPKEAKILVLTKDQRLHSMYKRLTKPIVKEYLKDTVEIS